MTYHFATKRIFSFSDVPDTIDQPCYNAFQLVEVHPTTLEVEVREVARAQLVGRSATLITATPSETSF